MREALAAAQDMASSIPQWLAADDENLTASTVRLPEPDEIRLPLEIDFTKVIELYTC